MIGMYRVEPIIPPCNLTGTAYILLMVVHLTRFLWAKSFTRHTVMEVVDMHEHHVSQLFDHSESVYMDNCSHFVDGVVQKYCKERVITHYTNSIKSPLIDQFAGASGPKG